MGGRCPYFHSQHDLLLSTTNMCLLEQRYFSKRSSWAERFFPDSLSRRLYLMYPLYHSRIAIKEAIKMFSYFRQSVLHMCYATLTILCFISRKRTFSSAFSGTTSWNKYVSTKLQIRKENRSKVGRVPRNVGRYEESVNGDLWESLRELWIGQP